MTVVSPVGIGLPCRIVAMLTWIRSPVVTVTRSRVPVITFDFHLSCSDRTHCSSRKCLTPAHEIKHKTLQFTQQMDSRCKNGCSNFYINVCQCNTLKAGRQLHHLHP